jgi:hypothetical protein
LLDRIRGRHTALARRNDMRGRVAAILMATALVGRAGATDVHVGINIGVPVPPPPAIVVPAPPRLVVVPGAPQVSYAPDLSVNFFMYGGSYYTFHDGSWFIASAYNGPWTYVERVHVPAPVLVVPYRYYRVPPGHAKRFGGGHPHGMPPGQAKKLYRGHAMRTEFRGYDREHRHGDHHGRD